MKLPIVNHLNLQQQSTKWLRQRVSDMTLYKSVNSLIEDKKEDKLIFKPKLSKSIESSIIPSLDNSRPKFKISKSNQTNQSLLIDPKYLFTDINLQKIIKLKNIFLEFDSDGSKKLELNELFEMFEKNNIPVSLEELINLFFPERKFKEHEEPYLDFYQLYLFAMDKNSDHKFRVFMREIKKKIEQNKNKEVLSNIFTNNEKEKIFNSSLLPSNGNSRKSSINGHTNNVMFKTGNLLSKSIQNKVVKEESESSKGNANESYSQSNSISENISKSNSIYKPKTRKSSILKSSAYSGNNFMNHMKNDNFQDKIDKMTKDNFLPMNFKLLLEYLNSKGKLRESEQIIKDMNKLMIKFNEKDFNDNIRKKTGISSHIDKEHHDDFPHEDISLEKAIKYFQNMLSLSHISIDDEDATRSKIINKKPYKLESSFIKTKNSVLNIQDKKSSIKNIIKDVKSKLNFMDRVSLDLMCKQESNLEVIAGNFMSNLNDKNMKDKKVVVSVFNQARKSPGRMDSK